MFCLILIRETKSGFTWVGAVATFDDEDSAREYRDRYCKAFNVAYVAKMSNLEGFEPNGDIGIESRVPTDELGQRLLEFEDPPSRSTH